MLALATALLACAIAGAANPAVLFVSPRGPDQVPAGATADLDQLKELTTEGFEVDWTSTLKDVNRTRLWKYNVLVVFCVGMDDCEGGFNNDPTQETMSALVLEYIA